MRLLCVTECILGKYHKEILEIKILQKERKYSFQTAYCGWTFEEVISYDLNSYSVLTHWGRMTHICVSKLTIIGSDNGLSPGRRQAIIQTNVGTLIIGPQVTTFCEIIIEIHTFSIKIMHLKMSSWKCRWRAILPRPQCVNGKPQSSQIMVWCPSCN